MINKISLKNINKKKYIFKNKIKIISRNILFKDFNRQK